MSTFSTRRRQGFEAPRQAQGDLDVFRTPSVGSFEDDTPDRVLQVLAAIGATAGTAGYLRRQRSNAEDALMVGIANQLYAARADVLASEVANDPNVPVDSDQLSGYVSQRVENEIAGSGFEDNAEAAQAFRARMTGFLMGQAVSARDARVQKVRQESLLDASGGYISASDPTTVDAALREIDPTISDSQIQAFRANAAAAAAIDGDSEAVNRLLVGVDDPRAVATIKANLRSTLESRQRDAEGVALKNAEELVFKAIKGPPLEAAAALASVQGTIPAKDFDRLSDAVDRAKDADTTAAFNTARSNVFDTLFERGSDAAQESFNAYVEAGIFTNAQRPQFASDAQQYVTAQYGAKFQDIGARIGRIDPASPSASSDISAAMGEIDALAAEIEGRNRLMIDDPYAFGAVDPGVSSGVMAQARKLAEMAEETKIRSKAVGSGIAALKEGRKWVPQDIALPTGTLTAEEQANAVIESRWQEIQRQIQDPTLRLTALTKDLALVPSGTSSFIAAAVAGIPSLGFAVANEQDATRRKEMLADLNRAVENYRIVGGVNWEVAKRHLPKEDIDTADYIVAAIEAIPQNKVGALRAAMANVRNPQQFSDMLKSSRLDKLVASTIGAAGLSEAGTELMSEVRTKIAVYATGLGMTPEQAASRVAQGLRDKYETRQGKLLNTGDSSTGKYINPDVLEQILLETAPAEDRNNLVLSQVPGTGQWTLTFRSGEDMGLPAVTPINGDQALRLVTRAELAAGELRSKRGSLTAAAVRDLTPAVRGGMAEGDAFTSLLSAAVDKMNSVVVKRSLQDSLRRIADARIAAESDPLSRAARVIARRLAGLEPSTKTPGITEPTDEGVLIGGFTQ